MTPLKVRQLNAKNVKTKAKQYCIKNLIIIMLLIQ